jgi:hypothetical protein
MLSNILIPTGFSGDAWRPGELSGLVTRLVLLGFGLLCLLLSFSTLHFYYKYRHAEHQAQHIETHLQSRVAALTRDSQNLQMETATLSKTLDQTKAALALASRSTISTTLPTPKKNPPSLPTQ